MEEKRIQQMTAIAQSGQWQHERNERITKIELFLFV